MQESQKSIPAKGKGFFTVGEEILGLKNYSRGGLL
jgi:hypothetical protein